MNNTQKRLSSTTNKTLDTQHTHKIKQFNEQHTSLEDKQRELSAVQLKIADYRKFALSNLTQHEFDDYMSAVDEEKSLKHQIVLIENSTDELEYYVDTADIIFKYYEIIEKKDNHNTSFISNSSTHENSILKFFVNTHQNPDKSSTQPQDDDRATLLDKYMEQVDENFIKLAPNGCAYEDAEGCPICSSKNRTVLINDGLMYCNDCHTIETIIIDHEKPSYKDPPKEISYFSYKRSNHLNEWISQVQGKESTDIPTEVYDRILLEINKQRITNMAEITPAKIKQILKALKLNRYYEHTPHIINRLNGAPTPNFTPEIEKKLREMFNMIQIPFFNHAPKTRKNFLSYSYTLHKCLQLLELDEYLQYFPLLRSREKTFAMDQIWKKICADLKWSFIPSI